MYVGLPIFYAKTNIHTYIHTNKLTTRQVGFCTTSKLEFHVCLPMQATELYNQHGKSTVFSKIRNFKFHGQGHVFRRKRKKNVKNEFFDVAYVCMFVNFAHAGRGKRGYGPNAMGAGVVPALANIHGILVSRWCENLLDEL